MISLVYKIALSTYYLILQVASLFNRRAQEWLDGRKGNLSSLKSFRNTHDGKLIWFHCSSLGEFEQALPLIERIKKEHKDILIAATFYSPSGYKYQKDNPLLDWVGYLPHDTKSSMRAFIDEMNPSKVIIVKNEWWWHMLEILTEREIDIYYISVSLENKSYFIRHPFAFFKDRLSGIRKIFTVNQSSKDILDAVTNSPVLVSGDTKFDRAYDNKLAPFEDPIMESYQPCIIYGSVWDHDLKIIQEAINNHPEYNHVLFPHNLDKASIDSITQYLSTYDMYTTFNKKKSNVLVVNQMGILKYAYRYASKAYIGGGFGDGVHNLIEPVVYELPISCGPATSGIHEVSELVESGALTIVHNRDEFNNFITTEKEGIQMVNKIRSTDLLYNEIMGNDI